MDEFAFIATLLAPLAAGRKGALALRDDAALLSVPQGKELVVTKDALVAGVHFIGDEPADLIARKALRVNLSDLAAMGAEPYAYFLALMLPAGIKAAWLQQFARGLQADQQKYAITLMGGDTTHTPGPLALSVTALGLVPKGKALLRSGAQAGDDVYVSGTVGDAASGLQVLQGQLQLPHAQSDFLLSRYRLPEPRIALGKKLRGMATSCIDISDGLVQDLGHICTASGVGADVHWQQLPRSSATRLAERHLIHAQETILAGGDDYELLFTAPERKAAAIARLIKAAKTPITRIGKICKGKSVRVMDEKGREIALARKGYRHF